MDALRKPQGRAAQLGLANVINRWGLSAMEIECLVMAQQGIGPHAIGKKLCISAKTVSTHMTRAKRKMLCDTALEAILKWDRENWERPEVLKPIQVLQRILAREPTEKETRVHFSTWELNPKTWEMALELARAKGKQDGDQVS